MDDFFKETEYVTVDVGLVSVCFSRICDATGGVVRFIGVS
jgi:hypothetical protein